MSFIPLLLVKGGVARPCNYSGRPFLLVADESKTLALSTISADW